MAVNFTPSTNAKIASTFKMAIKKVSKITFPLQTQDPFLFGVYHKDLYPPGNEKMEAPVEGNGRDFEVFKEYRMYHGKKIPGFPQHPHRGFETVTATLDGIIDHTDSLGCSGRYGFGDLQWMTAGKGVVHGENFPLLEMAKQNPLRFFQIWLNLPARSKMVPPTQVMHWAENIPRIQLAEGKITVTVWAGEIHGHRALPPPENSWAADPANDVGIFFVTMVPESGTFTIPAAKKGTNRSVFFIQGRPSVNGELLEPFSFIEVDETAEILVESKGAKPLEFLVLQGQPIGEPVAQQGPFVMNTDAEIQQAFMDYQRTKFGGWPWAEDAVIFPRSQGRFVCVDGKTENPPVKTES